MLLHNKLSDLSFMVSGCKEVYEFWNIENLPPPRTIFINIFKENKSLLTWLLGRWKNREHSPIFDSSPIHCVFWTFDASLIVIQSKKDVIKALHFWLELINLARNVATRQITLWSDKTESVTLLCLLHKLWITNR